MVERFGTAEKADRIAQRFAAKRPVFADAFHASRYRLLRTPRTVTLDPTAWVELEPIEAEAGRCEFITGNPGAGYVATGMGIGMVTTFTAELPHTTTATQDDIFCLVIDTDVDEVVVTERRFGIVDVARGDGWDLFPVATLEERR